MSQVSHLEPGLCGARQCPRICSRVCHCEAGLRRSRAQMAKQAARRFAIKANRRQETVCDQINKAGLCPSICQHVGGCFLPQPADPKCEAKRKVFRCQKAVDLLVQLRETGRPKEVTHV